MAAVASRAFKTMKMTLKRVDQESRRTFDKENSIPVVKVGIYRFCTLSKLIDLGLRPLHLPPAAYLNVMNKAGWTAGLWTVAFKLMNR